MPLIFLTANHTQGSVMYPNRTVIDATQSTADWLVGLNRATKIVAGPGAFDSSITYPQNSLVCLHGFYYVSLRDTTAGEVPAYNANTGAWGVASYQTGTQLSSGPSVAEFVRGESGDTYRLSVVNVDGQPAVSAEPVTQ